MALRTSISSKVKAGAPVFTRRDLPDGENHLVCLAGLPLTIINPNDDGFESLTPLEKMFSFTKFELCRYAKATGSKATKDLEIHNASWVYTGVKHGEYGSFADPSYDLGLLNPQVPDGWNAPPRCFSLSVAYPVLRNTKIDDFGNYVEGSGELALLELPQDSNEPEFVIDPKSRSLAGLMFNKLMGAGKRQAVVDGNIVQLDGPLGTMVVIKKNSKAAPRDMYELEIGQGVADPAYLTEHFIDDVDNAVLNYFNTGMKRWAYYNDLLATATDDNINDVALAVVNQVRVKVLDSFDFFYDASSPDAISKAWAEKLDLMTIEASDTVELEEEAVQRVPIGNKRKKRSEKDGAKEGSDLPF